MADIVLKDKNGEDVTYEGVKAVTLPTSEGTSKLFLDATYLLNYWVRSVGNGKYYVIEENRLHSTKPNGVFSFMSNEYAEDNGKESESSPGRYLIGIVYTTKQLVIGESYTIDEMIA